MSQLDSLSARLAAMALAGLSRVYPHKASHVVLDASDERPLRELTPSFFGCFDWHSSVHSHWTLARLLARYPEAPWAAEAHAALYKSLSEDKLGLELRFRRRHPRFEVPYGVAWLLLLSAELKRTNRALANALTPLAEACGADLASWLRALPAPIRGGEHSQSAFAMLLTFEACPALRPLLRERARAFYGRDRDAPLSYEPSAYDFLSPTLAEALLMSRAVDSEEFSSWLRGFAPVERLAELTPVATGSRSDGKLVHWDGLNFSRAWMLGELATHPAVPASAVTGLHAAREAHLTVATVGLGSSNYAGSHWLASFALLALSGLSGSHA